MGKFLKFLVICCGLVTIVASCGKKQNGQLIGVLDRPKWGGLNPYGMVYVPSGTLHIGAGDQDVNSSLTSRPKSVSVVGFYMDDTEITNNEYRQFVYYVRDSLAHARLDHFNEDDNGQQTIDWTQKIDWTDEALEDMYYKGAEQFIGSKEYDIRKFMYEYQWRDWNLAAHATKYGERGNTIKKDKVMVYPDTLVWVRDFAYSYNEPMTRNYFWHPAFDDYPVVGVNWRMAKAFCFWRTQTWNKFKSTGKRAEPNTEEFRLPFESEWEYASRGGHDLSMYPWGSYYTRNTKGCLLANFKPGRGNYPEDGGFYTVKADAYFANDYGLYNMSGNVSEWTETSYQENAYSFIHDLNPNITYDAKEDDPAAYKRKVVRGGSWKDIAYYLQTNTRHYDWQDTTKSYIGFRCALTFLGRSINDF
jgi:sulfatase modifying factor 1